MSFFDKQAKQAILKQVEKKIEQQKAKLSGKPTASSSTAHDGTEKPYVPPYQQHSSNPHQQYRPPPGYPGSSHQPSSSSTRPQHHPPAGDKKNWQDKIATKLNDPSVRAKAQQAAKSKATKKATKSLMKGATQLLSAAFEE